jgi:hypothetical protein
MHELERDAERARMRALCTVTTPEGVTLEAYVKDSGSRPGTFAVVVTFPAQRVNGIGYQFAREYFEETAEAIYARGGSWGLWGNGWGLRFHGGNVYREDGKEATTGAVRSFMDRAEAALARLEARHFLAARMRAADESVWRAADTLTGAAGGLRDAQKASDDARRDYARLTSPEVFAGLGLEAHDGRVAASERGRS